LVTYAIETARSIADATPALVIDEKDAAIESVAGNHVILIKRMASQTQVQAMLDALKALPDQSDPILVTYANAPLMTAETLRLLLERHRERISPITVLGPTAGPSAGPARSNSQHQVCAYCFDAGWLQTHISADQSLHEDSVRELLHVAANEGLPVTTLTIDDPAESLRIRTRVDLARAETALRRRINERWMLVDVTIVDPATTYIEPDVRIGPDTIIHPNTHLRGQTRIGAHCAIGPNTIVEDCLIGNRCRVLASVLEQAVMEDEADVGPFGHVRKGARLCRGAHMGNFGEVKNATLGPGAKMGHFSYLGDAEVGAEANIGAGAITCNYDGVRKHPTVIEAEAFIGSGSMLVAPLRIGKRAKTGAGSVVTHDVPAESVVYGVPARVKSPSSEKREADE